MENSNDSAIPFCSVAFEAHIYCKYICMKRTSSRAAGLLHSDYIAVDGACRGGFAKLLQSASGAEAATTPLACAHACNCVCFREMSGRGAWCKEGKERVVGGCTHCQPRAPHGGRADPTAAPRAYRVRLRSGNLWAGGPRAVRSGQVKVR